MSGTQRLPGGQPRKASQRHSRRAAPVQPPTSRLWRPGDRVRWRVTGRAWDGDRPFDDQQLSEPYLLGDRRTGELALLETLSRAFCGAVGGLIGWSALVPEAREPRATV